jgi:hypothetical protein
LHAPVQRKEELLEDYWSLRPKINVWVEIKIFLTLIWKILYSHGTSGFHFLCVETIHALLAYEFVHLCGMSLVHSALLHSLCNFWLNSVVGLMTFVLYVGYPESKFW